MINISFHQLIFFAFASMLISSAAMTILARNPVRSALFLVMAFFAAAGLWILLEAEFLGLVLILVYVGAVMTLFLFVVMTLNVNVNSAKQSIWPFLPYAILIVLLLVALVSYVIHTTNFALPSELNAVAGINPSNTKALGAVLYTDYAYPFELAGVLLLVAIIAAISLTFRGRQGSKAPLPEQQIIIKREDRIRIIKMNAEKKP